MIDNPGLYFGVTQQPKDKEEKLVLTVYQRIILYKAEMVEEQILEWLEDYLFLRIINIKD